MTSPTPSWQSAIGHHSGGALDLYGNSLVSYAKVYRTQPNIRIGIDFVARNVAQLGVGVFRRMSDTDRLRLNDHELAQWLTHPNPWTTRYRLIENLLKDFGTYENAYWLKVRMAANSLQRIGLIRVPPAEMSIEGRIRPTAFIWTQPNGVRQAYDPSEFVYFGGYDPDNPLMGLSMLYTMQRILAEEAAAGDYRQSLWGNSTRMEGVIERPVTAKKWSPEQRQEWREQWQDAFASGGARPGSVAVLEDGMSWKPISFSSKDSEYVSARKLVREYCAASQHIPQPFVGILDHATFSNIREQHKNLYQDTLGPALEMIQQEIERQLLPECLDQDRVYVEFNIQDKLKGSFEEQATSLQQLVGRPIMTANEGRARLNLPSTDDPQDDELAPQQGGPAAAPGVPPVVDPAPGSGGKDEVPVDDEEEIDGRIQPVLLAHRARQTARLEKLPIGDRPAAFAAQLARWTRELAEDLTAVYHEAGTHAINAVALAQHENAATLSRLEIEALHG